VGDATLDIQFTLDRRTRRIEGAATYTTEASRPASVSAAARALALAIDFEHLIECGDARDYADVARLACLSRERVSQIAMLRFLAPDLQNSVLNGTSSASEAALRRIASLHWWAEQRAACTRLITD
jgi:hypothetical protein